MPDTLTVTPLCWGCAAPASTTVAIGCAHEHVDRLRMCRACADGFLRDAAGGRVRCKRCGEAPGVGHTCLGIAREQLGDPAVDLTPAVASVTLTGPASITEDG